MKSNLRVKILSIFVVLEKFEMIFYSQQGRVTTLCANGKKFFDNVYLHFSFCFINFVL